MLSNNWLQDAFSVEKLEEIHHDPCAWNLSVKQRVLGREVEHWIFVGIVMGLCNEREHRS